MALRTTLRMEFPRTEVAVTAWRFTLSERSGTIAGTAVVCVEARYCSVLWLGHPRPTRRRVAPTQWRQVESEGYSLVLGPLDGQSVLAALIRGERGRSVCVTLIETREMRTDVFSVPSTLDGLLTEVEA